MVPLMAGQMPVVVVPGGEFAVALRDRLLPGRDDPCYFRRLCLYLCFCVLVFVAQPAGSTRPLRPPTPLPSIFL